MASKKKHGMASKKSIEDLETMLLRHIISAHLKVQKKFLYLEAGAIQLGHVITTIRMMYLQTILKCPQGELIREVPSKQTFLTMQDSSAHWVVLI